MTRGTVLIADDCSVSRQILKSYLVARNFAVEIVRDPDDAEAYLSQCEILPHLIIADLEMPVMNGLLFHERLSTTRFKDIPFVFSSMTLVPYFLNIRKPVKPEVLDFVLEKLEI